MATEGAKHLGCSIEDLGAQICKFVEADGNVWKFAESTYSASQRTWISALLACEVLERYPQPRICEFFKRTQRWKDLIGRLDFVAPDPRTYALYKNILGQIYAFIPYPASLESALEILKLLFNGDVPVSYVALLELLGAQKILALPSGNLDAIKAAEQVSLRDKSFVRELIEARVLPQPLEDLARNAGSRSRDQQPSPVPVQYVARLSGEACGAFIYGLPLRLPAWSSVRDLFPHLDRLSDVLEFSQPATLYPSQGLLGAVQLDEQGANAYDQRLIDDARFLAEDLIEAEMMPEEAARQKAIRTVMSGFQPFVACLKRINNQGARITSFPHGIAGAYNRQQLYKGVREDLSPRPDILRSFLAVLPELLEGEDVQLGHWVILQFVTGARAAVVLGLDRTCWIDDDFGVLLHVRSASNKTGRSCLFLAAAWIELFNITREWLPEAVGDNPPNWLRNDLSDLIDRVCVKFENRTGKAVPRGSARFTRSAIVQLLRTNLDGHDREVVTALLGHRSRFTRSNYWRAWPEEVESSYSRWDNNFRGMSYALIDEGKSERLREVNNG